MQNNYDMVYNNFNILRLLAALQVVYIHAVKHLNIQTESIIAIRDIIVYFPGVPVFFLISGYLITMSYDKNQNLYEYTRNRFLRIVPGLYMSFFVSLVILLYFNQLEDIEIIKFLLWCFAQLTLFQFYNPEFIRNFGVGVINGSLWTISVEISFYILLPFIYIFLKNDIYKNFLFLLLISFAFYYYQINISSNTLIYEKLIKVSILPYLFYFLFGFYIYKYMEFLKKYIIDKFYIYSVLYMIVIFFSFDSFIYIIIKQIVFTVFIFSLVFSYRNLSYKILRHNDFTYGIYIYHMLIINIFVQVGYVESMQSLLATFILSLILGVISYFFIEKPFLNMKKKSLYNEINK